MEPIARQTPFDMQSDPDGDLVENIIIGGRLFCILESVVKGGFLDNLENEAAPISVTSFCDKYAYRADVMERILNLLVCTGLVVKTKINDVWKYANSQSASKYLTKASPKDRSCAIFGEKGYVANMLSKVHEVVKNGSLTSAPEFFSDPDRLGDKTPDVKSSVQNINARDRVNINEIKKSAVEKQPTKKDTSEMSQSTPVFTSEDFIKIMDSMIYSTQHIIPRVFDFSSHRKAVDLGGGSGFMAKLFVDLYPQMAVQVFELPHVANAARARYQSQMNCQQRLTFVGGDFFKDELPSADLYILAHILHSWGEPEIHKLLEKVFDSLPSGGELLVLEKFLNEEKDGPVHGLTMDIMMAMISKGRERTQSEYAQLLEDHGFVNTRVRIVKGNNSYDAMLASKPV